MNRGKGLCFCNKCGGPSGPGVLLSYPARRKHVAAGQPVIPLAFNAYLDSLAPSGTSARQQRVPVNSLSTSPTHGILPDRKLESEDSLSSGDVGLFFHIVFCYYLTIRIRGPIRLTEWTSKVLHLNLVMMTWWYAHFILKLCADIS